MLNSNITWKNLSGPVTKVSITLIANHYGLVSVAALAISSASTQSYWDATGSFSAPPNFICEL